MKVLFPILLALAIAGLPASAVATPKRSACKPTTYMGVNGCELLPDQTCPPGYHKQGVGPTNPRMKAPTRLMCVADKPSAKKRAAKAHTKPNM